jgi:hypothetical protein
VLLAACRIPDNALDGPLSVPLRITATPDAIEIDAPTWLAAETAVYLCSAEPDPLPAPGPARVGWEPAADCGSFGRHPSTDGLRVVLELDELSAAERPSFDASATWYVLLVKVDGDRAAAALHTSFAQPEGFE